MKKTLCLSLLFTLSQPLFSETYYFPLDTKHYTNNISVDNFNSGNNNEGNSNPQPSINTDSCLTIKQTNNSAANGVYTLTSGEDVFCDMTNDGGGWTLVLTISNNTRGDSLTSRSAFSGTVPSDLNNMTESYLYQGNIANFTSDSNGEVREGVACSTYINCQFVYGIQKNESQLNTIIDLFNLAGNSSITMGNVPSCTNNYASFEAGNDSQFTACDNYNYGNTAPNYIATTILGWQIDQNSNSGHCWAARPTAAAGSPNCVTTEPNGSLFSVLWMR